MLILEGIGSAYWRFDHGESEVSHRSDAIDRGAWQQALLDKLNSGDETVARSQFACLNEVSDHLYLDRIREGEDLDIDFLDYARFLRCHQAFRFALGLLNPRKMPECCLSEQLT